MGVVTNLVRGLIRGADRTAEFTSKRGCRSFYKPRGTKLAGHITSSGKFIKVPSMVPEFVVPDLRGFKLKPYVSYKAPKGTEEPMTAKKLFDEAVAPLIEKDIQEATFDVNNLEKYGFEPTQEGKLLQLYPKNFVR